MDYICFDAMVLCCDGVERPLHADIYNLKSVRTRGSGKPHSHWKLQRPNGEIVTYIPKDTLPDGFLKRCGKEHRPLCTEMAQIGDEVWAKDQASDEVCFVGTVSSLLPVAMVAELGDQS